MFKKKYYFALRKGGHTQSGFLMYLYLKDKKFKWSHQLHSSYLLPWYQAYWYFLLFNLPSWIKTNGDMFSYSHVKGAVLLLKIK